MNILDYKGYEGTAEIDISRGVCRGKILFINDLVTYESDTITGLKREFEAAVDDYLLTCETLNKEPQRPCKGLFNVRVPPAIHRAATLRAIADGVTLNEITVRSLDAFLNVNIDVSNHFHFTVTNLGDEQINTLTASAAAVQPQWRTTNVHH